MLITVVLIEDHAVVRQSLRAYLDQDPKIRVVGEAQDGFAGIELVEKVQPDLVILDLMLSGMNGLEVTRQVHKRHPKTRILILSMHSDEGYVVDALQNGAVGYVLKGAPAEEFHRAIYRVMLGFRYLSPPLSDQVLNAYLARVRDGDPDPYASLTTREREVLHLSAEGLSNKEIAGKLSISPRTVETHRMNMMRKLALENQSALVRYAMRRGVIN
jgi:DNA-binding NarL/FixJ family response regulator